MNDYIICMDASGDIIREAALENEIQFVPMEYSIGEEMRTSRGCESEELLKTFYDGQRGGDLTKTSQISPYMYEEYFKQFLELGKSILYFCLSGGLSSTYQSAVLAAETLKEDYPEAEVIPVDTLAATGGIGLLVEKAIENRKDGMSIQENLESVRAVIPRLRHYFMVQDLMYLKRGGRVSAATAIVGSALNIKPMLIVNEEGKLVNVDKKRGNKAAMSSLFASFKENYDPETDTRIYICDSDAPELAQGLAEKIKEAEPGVTIRRTMLSPIIGAHTGPGMVAVILFGKEKTS